MELVTVLCTLLQSVCHIVTSVEGDSKVAPKSGPDKKAAAIQGVGAVLDGLIAQGAQFVRSEAEGVASEAIDSIVGLANKLGAFTHGTPPRTATPDAHS